jgi:hypothetical protein
MDSRSIAHRGFRSKEAFACTSEQELLELLPTSPGVYVVFLAKPEARHIGHSDVAYIGTATNVGGLRGRLRQYFHPGVSQSTNIAMRKRLSVVDCSLQITWVTSESSEFATRLESDLLIQFDRDHGELPPFNRRRALDLISRSRDAAIDAIELAQGSNAMPRATFRLIGFDEGGVRGTPDSLRLVCLLEGSGKLAIWGKANNSKNIEKVVAVALPCSVECEYRPPATVQAERFGHTHWVREDFNLRVLK